MVYALLGVAGLFALLVIVFIAFTIISYNKERPYERGYDQWLPKTIARLASKHPLSYAWDACDGIEVARGLSPAQMVELMKRLDQRHHWAVWGIVQGYLVHVERADVPASLRPFVNVGPTPLPEDGVVVSPAHAAMNRFNETAEQYDHARELHEWLNR